MSQYLVVRIVVTTEIQRLRLDEVVWADMAESLTTIIGLPCRGEPPRDRAEIGCLAKRLLDGRTTPSDKKYPTSFERDPANNTIEKRNDGD